MRGRLYAYGHKPKALEHIPDSDIVKTTPALVTSKPSYEIVAKSAVPTPYRNERAWGVAKAVQALDFDKALKVAITLPKEQKVFVDAVRRAARSMNILIQRRTARDAIYFWREK
jgi:hypothetical protein